VDVEDLFDEFSYGEKTPQAVKDFFSYAATTWKAKPSFVLLAGDASLDPRNYLGFGDNDLVPTRLVDTSLMETACDDWFTDFKNDGQPEISIGRLPFRSPDEAQTMVAKIISYEDSKPSAEALLVSDRNDEFDFETASDQIQHLMPSGLKVNRLNRASLDPSNAKLQLFAAIARGQTIVNYVGHGSSNQWNGGLLTNDDARSMTNGDRLPLFVMMTCLNGYFHDAATDGLAEALLKSERGGAVAVWASTGVTSPNRQAAIDREFYRLLFSRETLTIGEAATRAKGVVSDPDIKRTWVLLGDPTMRVKFGLSSHTD